MTDADAFLQAIQEEPDSDEPRLVFADWLEEHGDPRSEFIRVQCELAALPAGDDRRRALKARERDLWAEHGDAWAGPLRRWASDCTFRRGFATRVTVAARVFLDHADELFRLAPV